MDGFLVYTLLISSVGDGKHLDTRWSQINQTFFQKNIYITKGYESLPTSKSFITSWVLLQNYSNAMTMGITFNILLN